MDRAIRLWLQDTGRDGDLDLRLPYTVYGCMLLFPPSAFRSDPWRQIMDGRKDGEIERLHDLIAMHLKVTHMAITQPIPILEAGEGQQNVIRAPRNFTPVYGDFGPTSCSSPPTRADLDASFWVTAKQNGIYQVWAPRWTMFSRGNVSEKARLLTLDSVLDAVEHGKADGRGCAAVDLYAGIGYFAFSYLKAGVDQVLCWDLNPWSIQGLRKGAAANKWKTTVCSTPQEASFANDSRILAFNESNEMASDRVHGMRGRLPPIRHVNCGLLPTSRGSWQTAVDVLDPELRGWVHVHENSAVDEIGRKAEEVREAFQQMSPGTTVQIDHVNRLKSYAPGVMHCVIDIHIQARAPPNT